MSLRRFAGTCLLFAGIAVVATGSPIGVNGWTVLGVLLFCAGLVIID